MSAVSLMMYVHFILGPGNVHFDYGQDVFFIKFSREYPLQSGMARDAERRLAIFQFWERLAHTA